MTRLDERTIKSFTGEIIYIRAMNYYRQNMIKNIYRTDNDEEEIIEAIVGSNTDTDKEYSVRIEIRKFTGLMQVSCNCPYYTSGKGNMCKHIGAVLIRYVKDIESIPQKYDNTVDRYLQSVNKALVMMSEDKKELKIDIVYNQFSLSVGTASLELKVGEDKKYIIRNIKDFMGAVINKKNFQFSVNFTYDPEIHEFSHKDKPIIEMLMEIYEIEKKIQEKDYFNKEASMLMKGRVVSLNDSQAKRFFKLMGDMEFTANIWEKEYTRIKVINNDMPINFNIYQNKECLVIAQPEEKPIRLTLDGEYMFYKGAIYHLSKAQRLIYMSYYNELRKKHKDELVFPMSASDKVIKNVLPLLKKISDNVIVDHKLEERIYEKPLKAVVFLDKTKKSISADLRFTYGEFEFNPMNENTNIDKTKIIIRDYEKEKNIYSYLENYGFKRIDNQYIYSSKEEKIYDFLYEGIEKLRKNSEIYYSKEFTNMKVINPSFIKTKISLNNEDLLELNFNIEGVEAEEIKQVLRALIEKKKYYKLKKGDILALQSESFTTLSKILDKLEVQKKYIKEEGLNFNKFNAIYLESILDSEKNIEVQRNDNFKKLINNFNCSFKSDYEVPALLDKIMRDYQKEGFAWFKTLASCGFGGILADEMGLGKTLETIAFILSDKDRSKPNLVISPSSLIYNWEAEIRKFSPELKTLVVCGSKKERIEAINTSENYNVVITSYPLIRRDIEEYIKISFISCIIDEAQAIKNPLSQSAYSVKRINAKYHFALTGTPIENSLMELWSIFDFIMPGYLSTYREFSQKYEIPIVKENDLDVSKDLRKHVSPFILRRKKKDVIKELPPKIEHKLIVDMTEEQKKIYSSYLAMVKNEIKENINEKGFNKSKIKILAILTRLRQICCHPSLFIDKYKGKSGKLEALYEVLEGALEENHRILIFSQFTSVLKIILSGLEKRNISYFYLDGSTKNKERIELTDRFNLGEKQVFAISLKAGGSGLNLTGADTVIHFDPWWNPAVEAQASDRAHRIGQKKSVEVIKLITKGTIEEKIYKLQERKKELINSLMETEEIETNIFKTMTEEDINELFKD